MKERLVADWLTKAGERGGLDVAYCQILLAQGCQILRAGHSPTEAGKDIIAIAPNRELRAYQIKSGNIGLKEFEAIQPQITALVEAAILHPSVCRGLEHRSFLVTTGKFSEPVETRVQGFNDAWQRRGFKPLTLIRGTELQPAFMSLAADFWPEEPPEVRAFLALYLAEGKGDFDHKAFAGFLLRLLPEKKLSKPAVARRIAAAGLFASYLLESFNRQGDHWSAFCGWTITAAYQAWAAEVYQLPAKRWIDSFRLTRAAAFASLEALSTESLAPNAFRPQEPELDDYTRMRNTVAASAVAAWHMMRCRIGEIPSSVSKAVDLIDRLARENRYWFWGESAHPNYLSIFWLLEHSGDSGIGEELLLQVVSLLTRYNNKFADNPLKGPEVLPDEVLSSMIKKLRHPEPRNGRRAPASWIIESLLHLLALRMRRQALKARWWDVTHVEMASFLPKRVADTLLWHCEAGEERERLPAKPESWRCLTAAAQTNDLNALPKILREDPDFALMFMLACPHRASTTLVKALDTWFR
jgi:DNA-directed RNA polymerase specialized sigma24 family protein